VLWSTEAVPLVMACALAREARSDPASSAQRLAVRRIDDRERAEQAVLEKKNKTAASSRERSPDGTPRRGAAANGTILPSCRL
jgi:hypothetical protein